MPYSPTMQISKFIIEDLQMESDQAYTFIYQKYYETVQRFILRNSGTSDDAQDIFQDTMLVVVEKLRKDNFRLTASLKTYVTAIAKHLWFKKLRDNRSEINLAVDLNTILHEAIDQS